MELMQMRNSIYSALGEKHRLTRSYTPEREALRNNVLPTYWIFDKIQLRVTCQTSSPKLDAVAKDDLMEDEKKELQADDPRYEEIRTELTTTEEETEKWESKREKDWIERRKYDEVDDIIAEDENKMYLQNKDMENRYSSFSTCWNDCSLSRISKKAEESNGRETCCSEYRRHQVFTQKESMDRVWNVHDSLKVKIEHTFDDYCTIEDHVDSKPTLVKLEQAPSWCLLGLSRTMSRRSLLKTPNLVSSSFLPAAHSLVNPLMNSPANNSCQESARTPKNLESDGDSPRSTSPQSSVTDEEEVFRSVRINRELKNEKLSDYISEAAASAGRDSLPSDDRRRRKEEDLPTSILESDIRRHTLSDHCYHQSKSMQWLRRETYSETDEEEIDVVSYEKKASYFNFAHKHDVNQLAINNFAQKQRSANQLALNIAHKQQKANLLTANIDKPAVRRPRGRPPGPNSAKRKRAAQIGLNETSGSAPKRARMQMYQRGQKRQKYVKQWKNQTFEDDEEEDDSAKRNLHNDMERQRRVSMKNFFDQLKGHVPTIAEKDRVAKVTILKEAELFVKEQQTVYHDDVKQLKQLEKQNSSLKKKFDDLYNEQIRMLRIHQARLK